MKTAPFNAAYVPHLFLLQKLTGDGFEQHNVVPHKKLAFPCFLHDNCNFINAAHVLHLFLLQKFTGDGFEQQVIPLSAVITPAIIQVALEDPSSAKNADGSFEFDPNGDATLMPRGRGSSTGSSGARSGSRAGKRLLAA
jgi:hypothetical protein